MSNVNTLKIADDPEIRIAIRPLDGTQNSDSATRNVRLQLVAETKTPDYWQTESRTEALKRAINRTG